MKIVGTPRNRRDGVLKLHRTFCEQPELRQCPRSLTLLLLQTEGDRPPWVLRKADSEFKLAGATLHFLTDLRSLDISFVDRGQPGYDKRDDRLPDSGFWVHDPLLKLFGVTGDQLGDALLEVQGLKNLKHLSFGAQMLHWAWLYLPLESLHPREEVLIELPNWEQRAD